MSWCYVGLPANAVARNLFGSNVLVVSCVCLNEFLFVRIMNNRSFVAFKHCCLAVELLQKLSICAAGKHENFSARSKAPGLYFSSKKLVNMKDYLSTIPSNMDLVFVDHM